MKQSILFLALIFSAFAFSACGGGGGGGSSGSGSGAPAGSTPVAPEDPSVVNPPVNADIYGKEITISFDSGRTIVFDFYPDQASDDFSFLTDKVDGKQYRVSWYTLGSYGIYLEGEYLPSGRPVPAAQWTSEVFNLPFDWGGTNDTATFTGTYTPDMIASGHITQPVSGTVTIVY